MRTGVGFPKGALTHHPGGEVVFPLEIVRSPRGLRLLRQPMDNATLEAKVLSLSTQLVCGMYRTEYRHLQLRYSTNCPHKPATGRFVAVMTLS